MPDCSLTLISLSRRERDVKPFSLREKGWDEGTRLKAW